MGYTTVSVSANKKDIFGVPFVNVGGATFNIQNITLSNPSDGNDWIMVFNPATKAYDTYFWFSEVYEDDSYEKSLGVSGWGDNYVAINRELDPGQGFWLQTQLACDMTLPGEVVAAESNSFETKANKKDIVACVYPVALDIQDIKLGNGSEGNDWIMVFNPSTRAYDTYFWFSEVYEDDSYEKSLGVAGWGDNYVALTREIAPGQGFWIQTQLASKVEFPSPFAK